jgi:hypothetical protein
LINVYGSTRACSAPGEVAAGGLGPRSALIKGKRLLSEIN